MHELPRPAPAAGPTICLVLHAHQPPNVSDAEIEQTVRCVYQPVLAAHAALGAPLTLNVQGCLLQRLGSIAPAFVERLRDLMHGKLIEFTASAHYHPCLPLLPRERRKRQIALNLRTQQQVLQIHPSGFWPPELAWTPALAEQLDELGLRWTIADGSAFLRAWDLADAPLGEPRAVYLPAELTRPYLLASAPGVTVVPRQHEWSRQLFEDGALADTEKLSASIAAMRMQAHGLICLATDAERISPETLRTYERLVRELSEFSELVTTTTAVKKYPAEHSIDLPVWTWRGALDEWIRGEGERSFLRELDDAHRRRADLAVRSRDVVLAEAVDDSLMQAECSCWLFWRTPCRFLAEGFARIGRAHKIMDSM